MELITIQPDELAKREPDIEDLIEDFLAEQDISENSKDTYSRSLKQFVSWIYESGRDGRLDLQREDILAYKDYLSDKASYTITLYLTSVRKLYQWLESKKIYPDITRNIKGAKKPKGYRKDILTPDQLRETLGNMDRSTLKGKRNYALFNLMARTALRDIEVSRALVEDIRQESGQPVLWVHGKGHDSKDDFVLLTEEALKPIKEYLKERGEVKPEDPLFCSLSDRNYGQAMTSRSISRIVKKALRKVGLDDKRLTAHSLRHTAISLSIQGGASLQQAQAMARHSDPKTTLVYFHNLQRIEAGAEKCIDF
jgi:integrase/recombinase XerC/integrase/recombinase XerD